MLTTDETNDLYSSSESGLTPDDVVSHNDHDAEDDNDSRQENLPSAPNGNGNGNGYDTTQSASLSVTANDDEDTTNVEWRENTGGRGIIDIVDAEETTAVLIEDAHVELSNIVRAEPMETQSNSSVLKWVVACIVYTLVFGAIVFVVVYYSSLNINANTNNGNGGIDVDVTSDDQLTTNISNSTMNTNQTGDELFRRGSLIRVQKKARHSQH